MATPGTSLVGKKLGPYRIETLLASGAMGDVFRGVHEQLSRPVAIKTLKDTVAADRDLVARFLAEARAVNLIRHENIVECTDLVSEDDGRTYMVMELLEGRTLGDAIRATRGMAPPRAVAIAMQIADALHAAHGKGIVHRDLKPENVYLIRRSGSDDYVKVLDFGIARLRPETSGMEATQSGALIGTPAYMSPEQVNGDPVGPPSDIYSLGVLLFHMLTGKPPFDGTSSVQIMMAHLSSDPPRVDTLAAVPSALADVVERALQKKIEDRPHSMAELRAELERAISPSAARTKRRKRETFGTEPTDPAADPTGDDHPPISRDEPAPSDAASLAHTTARDRPPANDTNDGASAPAADTVPNAGAPRSPLLAVAGLILVAGAVIAILVARSGSSPPSQAPRPAAETAERHALNGLLRDGHAEPLAPADCRASAPEVVESLIDAAGLLRGGTPGGARPDDRHALELLTGMTPPDRAATEYWHLLAKARLYAGEPPAEVIAAADRALRQCDRYAAPHLVAGTASFRADRNDDAMDRYSRALAIDPEFAAAHFNLGLVQLAVGDVQPAIESFTWVLDRDAEDADALIARGQAHLMTRDPALALRDLERAVELRPQSGDAQLLLGLAHEKAGAPEPARRAFCRARDLGVARADELCGR